MKSTDAQMILRGFADEECIGRFENLNVNEIIKLLYSNVSQERTAGAVIAGKRKMTEAIPDLCYALQIEKKLYSKIAISEALGSIGVKAMPALAALLGKIGSNQHKTLPVKSFAKKNYPLPRDIAARTIIKIGIDALPYLENVLKKGETVQSSEAIDAIGHIAYYKNEKRSLPFLRKCLNAHRSNNLIVWKIVRAFEAFDDGEVIAYLNEILNDSDAQSILKLEAKRSLLQIGKRNA